MGEGVVSGFVSAKSGDSAVVITIEGKINPGCFDQLKMLIANWAAGCGLILKSVTTTTKPSMSKWKKKKAKKK